jgi:acyl-CoA thioesterase
MTAREIVNRMMEQDAFSQWLGIMVDKAGAGTSELSLVVRPEMLNGFSVAHGGIAYSLADSALAFASNGHGEQAMSIECTVSYLKAVQSGMNLKAVATEKHRSKRLGRYEINIFQDEIPIALFYGTVLFLGKNWEN